MNISRKWLREFVDIQATDKEYDETMTIAGQKVETTTRMDADIRNVVVGRVLSMVRHENSDHMWVCMVDAGKDAPLQIVTLLGVVVFLASAVLGLHSLWQKFTGHALEGFTTVILLQLLIGSILMICLGIIGYYIAKIYEEIKDRPRYILADQCGGNDESASGKAV